MDAIDSTGNDEFNSLDLQLKQLREIEETLSNRYSQGAIAEEEYQKKIKQVHQRRKALEEKLNDSVAAILFEELSETLDPLAANLRDREEISARPETAAAGEELQFLEMKRGRIKDARVLEIKFRFHDKDCKALIDNQEGRWHIQTRGETIYMYKFKNALDNSTRFIELFEEEIQRHPRAWYDVVVPGKTYKEHNLDKNSRDNFPDECREILFRSGVSGSAPEDRETPAAAQTAPAPDKPLVIRKVDHGEYHQAGKKDLGRGYQEFPRFIVVLLDWGSYQLRAEINTDSRKWEVIPRAPIQDSSKKLLREFESLVPLMIQELEQAKNKFLAGVMAAEMRKKEYRHQWESVMKTASHLFPRECQSLFQTT
jgi:hypothetical protein